MTAPSVDTAWRRVSKGDRRACALADRHYSRRKVGSPQLLQKMPPGAGIQVAA